jgi:hypothetical protein
MIQVTTLEPFRIVNNVFCFTIHGECNLQETYEETKCAKFVVFF